MKLNFSYDLDVQNAYIIRVKGHQKSEELAKRCAESCEQVGMSYVFWDAYDGTQDVIKVPDHLGSSDFMKMVRLTDHYLTKTEVACALSHISLWVECMKLDRPIVILEHDAVMVQPYKSHMLYNAICYLGGREQFFGKWPVYATPPHGSDGPNLHFICRAHAYAIDPAIAKNMLAYILKMGIHEALDIMLRADIFPMYQRELYAYDHPDGTTIINRPPIDSGINRSNIRNDSLER